MSWLVLRTIQRQHDIVQPTLIRTISAHMGRAAVVTSASMVGLPRESRISRAMIEVMVDMVTAVPFKVDLQVVACSLPEHLCF